MIENIQVIASPGVYILQIESLKREIEKRDQEIKKLQTQLEYERELREQIQSSKEDTASPKKTKKRREVTLENKTYCDFKSDGKRKPHAADPIRSYDDFHAIQQYFLNAGRIRDWTLWTVGVSLGLRVSDLLSLKFCDLIEPDKKTFKKRVQLYEQKTGKSNDLLVTEAVIYAISGYLDSIKWEFDLDGFLFSSRKANGKMREESGWRIISEAGKALDLPLVIGSHTMRKSFANIAACVDKSCIDMNSITKIQGLLNHSDQKVTMRYLSTYQKMFDRARVAVSDFVMGKTEVNELIAGNQYTIDDVFERVDALEKILIERGN